MKQRLIDADKLEEYKADCCVPLTEWQEGWNDAIDIIMGETPIVDAIPVNWIEKFRNQFEPGDDDYNLIDGLLKIWRLENETD